MQGFPGPCRFFSLVMTDSRLPDSGEAGLDGVGKVVSHLHVERSGQTPTPCCAMNPTLRPPAVLLTLLCLTLLAAGCSKTPRWFLGTYEFDATESLRPLVEKAGAAKDEQPKPDGGLAGAVQGLATVFAPFALMKEFEGATVTIKPGEIIIMRGGSGKVVQFEVYQKPDADTVVIKTSENNIETWTRTPTGIAQKLSGGIDLAVPFKRKAP